MDYPTTYMDAYNSGKMSLEQAYAKCSSELLRLRMARERNLPYIKSLEFQENYLSCIIVAHYMSSKGYVLDDDDADNVHWKMQ